MLDERVFANRPDVECRVYGHYSLQCDLALARLLPHVRRFAADSLHRAVNVEAIAEMSNLAELSLGIFELDNLSVLEQLPSGLVRLSLGQTRSKKPDVSSLARFASLKELYIEGHSKGLDAIGELRDLEDLTLRSITMPDIEFLTSLPKLWSLDIKLGGTTNLGALGGMATIRYLELWQIRGLSDIGVVGDMPGLQNLFLQSLPQVKRLPSVDGLQSLRRLVLQNMKGITDLGPLERAPALRDFGWFEANGKQAVDVLPVLRNPSVQRVAAYFGSEKKNAEFARMRVEYGKTEFVWGDPFDYG